MTYKLSTTNVISKRNIMATRERDDKEDQWSDHRSEVQKLGNAMVQSLLNMTESITKARDDVRDWDQHIDHKPQPIPPPRSRFTPITLPEPDRLLEMHNPLSVFTTDKTWTSDKVYLRDGPFGYNVQLQLCKSNGVANAISARILLCCGPRYDWMTWPIQKKFVCVRIFSVGGRAPRTVNIPLDNLKRPEYYNVKTPPVHVMTVDELMDGKYVYTGHSVDAQNDILLIEISINQDDQELKDLKSSVKALKEAIGELCTRPTYASRRQQCNRSNPFCGGDVVCD